MSKKCANMRSIFDSFAENAEIVDWVAGRQSIRTPEPLFADQDGPP
jgi:hypothetical protein